MLFTNAEEDSDGNQKATIEAEFGEGYYHWNKKKSKDLMFFDGAVCCGKIHIDILLDKGEPKDAKIRHKCEDDECCFIEEFLEELGIEVTGKPTVQ